MLLLERHQRSTRSLVALDQNSSIIAVIEMSQSSWLVAGMLPGIERQPRKKLEPSPERLGRQAGTCRRDPGKATEKSLICGIIGILTKEAVSCRRRRSFGRFRSARSEAASAARKMCLGRPRIRRRLKSTNCPGIRF